MRDIRNYLLLLLSVAFVLLCLEAGFRVMAWRNDLGRLRSTGKASATRPTDRVGLGRIIQMSRNHQIIYELIPDRSFTFEGQEVNVNADGFRGLLIPRVKPPGTVRILGLGDSVMFGWGVAEDKTCLACLARYLNSDYPDLTWEVINTAVPGYNTAMQVATLKAKGMHYTPDIVIISFIDNDLALPNFIRDPTVFHSLTRSFLIDYFRGRLPSPSLVRAPRADDGTGFVGDPRDVPAEYKGMVGVDGYRHAMRELKSISVKNGFEVVVVSTQLLPDFVKDLCLSLGFTTAETGPVWLEYVDKNHIPDPRSAWRVSRRDAHPSALGHKVIADALLASLTRSGIVERAAQRNGSS